MRRRMGWIGRFWPGRKRSSSRCHRSYTGRLHYRPPGSRTQSLSDGDGLWWNGSTGPSAGRGSSAPSAQAHHDLTSSFASCVGTRSRDPQLGAGNVANGNGTGEGLAPYAEGWTCAPFGVAAWLSQLSNVPQQMAALNQCQSYAQIHHFPPLVAIDEAPTEVSPNALAHLLSVTPMLHYPVAVDSSGMVADAMGVQDVTWYALVNAHGRVIWAHDGSNNWLSPTALEAAVAKATSSSP